jgi:hypothetical protein
MAAFWNDEREALLKQLWAEDVSLSGIATKIGGGCTRCAVSGKARRLNLPHRISQERLKALRAIRQRRFKRRSV